MHILHILKAWIKHQSKVTIFVNNYIEIHKKRFLNHTLTGSDLNNTILSP